MLIRLLSHERAHAVNGARGRARPPMGPPWLPFLLLASLLLVDPAVGCLGVPLLKAPSRDGSPVDDFARSSLERPVNGVA